MKKFFKIGLITILSVNFIHAIKFDTLISDLEKKDLSITKIKAQYRQFINIVDLEEIYTIESEFIYMFPDQLRLEIKEPFQQIIVVKGNNLYLKNKNENIIYSTLLDKYIKQNTNIFPLIFSKEQRYNLSEVVKKIGLKYVNEEEKYYVLSTRYAKGKVYKDKKVGLRPGEIRFIMWINKESLFPEKVSMISEKYIIDTELFGFETDFEVLEDMFVIKKNSETKIIELK